MRANTAESLTDPNSDIRLQPLSLVASSLSQPDVDTISEPGHVLSRIMIPSVAAIRAAIWKQHHHEYIRLRV